jgi:hypothetical protein
MALVRIARYEVDQNLLPSLCIRCGRPAELWKSKKFAWYPPWVLALILIGWGIPYIIVALVLTQRMTVRVPLCHAWGPESHMECHRRTILRCVGWRRVDLAH